MTKIGEITEYLKKYNGPPIRIMEVGGTHTGVIARSGIESLLSDKIKLIAGPGCPVCVTVTAYIDRLCALAMGREEISDSSGDTKISEKSRVTVLTFGDLIRVPGSNGSLADTRSQGGSVQMLYSPADAVKLALEHRDTRYVFAAVGFETTAPVYAELLSEIGRQHIKNLQLLTALKTMPQVIREVVKILHHNGMTPDTDAAGCVLDTEEETGIDGFIAPGHVAVITGSNEYSALAAELGIPFAVSPFSPEGIIMSVYSLVKDRGQGICRNLYPSAVTPEGNKLAQEAVDKYFMKCDAAWRGMGVIPDSGMILRPEYSEYDAGSYGLTVDDIPAGCCCGQVLTGLIRPQSCPMFGRTCTPDNPYGACMVSEEGSCRSRYTYT